MSIHCVDFTSLFFLLLFKKFPHFPQVSNVCSFYTHFWGIFFVASETSVPPFKKKKKRSTIDSRRSYKVCGRLCYNVFNRCDNRRNKSKEKCTHPTPPTRYIQCALLAQTLCDGWWWLSTHIQQLYKKRGEQKNVYIQAIGLMIAIPSVGIQGSFLATLVNPIWPLIHCTFSLLSPV